MIPDKIYFPEGGLPAYIDWDGSPVRTKQVEDSDVCYIRKDAIISIIQSRLSEIIGDAQPKPILRAELEELITRIKKNEK